MGGSLQPPIHHPIVLKNSAKKAIKVVVCDLYLYLLHVLYILVFKSVHKISQQF